VCVRTSLPNEIMFRARLSDFDMREIGVIQAKARETGFIRVGELMKLQKTGFNHTREIPSKPTPKDRKRLRVLWTSKHGIAERIRQTGNRRECKVLGISNSRLCYQPITSRASLMRPYCAGSKINLSSFLDQLEKGPLP
jgi:hypothetical protein